jgi:hypothetical protein
MRNFTVLGLLIGFAGCGMDGETPEGLVLDVNEPAHATGTYGANGAAVAFDLARDNGAEHMVITMPDGSPLIDARIEDDGSHTTQVLGGRLVVHVEGKEPPVYTGDRTVMDAIQHMPEAAALSALEPALAAQNVDRALLPSKRMQLAPSSNSTQEGLFEYLPCGSFAGPTQVVECGSVFLGWTSMYLYNYSRFAEITYIWQGSWQPIYLFQGNPPYNPYFYDLSGWWWGAWVDIENYGVCPAHYYCPPGGVYSYNVANNDRTMLFTH